MSLRKPLLFALTVTVLSVISVTAAIGPAVETWAAEVNSEQASPLGGVDAVHLLSGDSHDQDLSTRAITFQRPNPDQPSPPPPNPSCPGTSTPPITFPRPSPHQPSPPPPGPSLPRRRSRP